MKGFGIVLSILGILALGAGGFAIYQQGEHDKAITENQDVLKEEFPGIEDILDLNSIEDLVALDREMMHGELFLAPQRAKDAPSAIMDGMIGKEDMQMLMLGGFGGGSVLTVAGLLLIFLGRKKKPAAA